MEPLPECHVHPGSKSRELWSVAASSSRRNHLEIDSSRFRPQAVGNCPESRVHSLGAKGDIDALPGEAFRDDNVTCVIEGGGPRYGAPSPECPQAMLRKLQQISASGSAFSQATGGQSQKRLRAAITNEEGTSNSHRECAAAEGDGIVISPFPRRQIFSSGILGISASGSVFSEETGGPCGQTDDAEIGSCLDVHPEYASHGETSTSSDDIVVKTCGDIDHPDFLARLGKMSPLGSSDDESRTTPTLDYETELFNAVDAESNSDFPADSPFATYDDMACYRDPSQHPWAIQPGQHDSASGSDLRAVMARNDSKRASAVHSLFSSGTSTDYKR